MGLLQIVFNGFLLSQRSWTPLTRVFDILVDIAGMILAVVILRTPGIFGITPDALTKMGMSAGVENLSRLFSFVPTLIITIVVIATAVQVGKSLLRIFSAGTSPAYPVMK